MSKLFEIEIRDRADNVVHVITHKVRAKDGTQAIYQIIKEYGFTRAWKLAAVAVKP